MGIPSIKVTFLGTGTSSGVPMIACTCPVCLSQDQRDKRFRSSILVESPNTSFVIDTTPDFRSQMLAHQVKKLNAVLFTHPHKDHIAGLDDVKAFSYFQVTPMKIFANAITRSALEREFSYVFSDKKYPGVPDIDVVDIAEEPFLIGDIPVHPIKVWHLHMPILGFRIGDFTYITDANRIDAEELEKTFGSKVLVLNALRKEKHLSHFALSEAVDVAQKVGAGQTYFTHISHQLGLHKDINAELPSGISLAHDGLVINLP